MPAIDASHITGDDERFKPVGDIPTIHGISCY